MVSVEAAASTKPRRYQLFIDGKWTDAESGKIFKTPNPATGTTLAEVAEADKADIDKAVRAARRAYEGPWSKVSARDRGRLLYKLSRLIEAHAQELAELETADNGKPIREAAQIDLPQVVETFEYFAGFATKIEGETIPVSGPMLNYTLREPVGVCGQIIPWNFPLLMAAWKLAPALAAGNTCVLKPAEQTPVTAMELAKLIQQAGFPDGVVNIVQGYGETAGAALASHPGVDKIAFTGSTEVGKLIARAAADHLAKVSLELGGKAPNIVFADADIDQAVNGAMMGIFFNQGQVCCAGSRLFLARQIKEQFLERFKEKARKLKIGDPMDPATHMGPQVSEEQLNRIKGYIDIGRREGATILTGGEPPRLPARVFLPADDLRRRQQSHAHRAGGDLRSGHGGHHVRGRRRLDQTGQRDDLRSLGRHLDARPRARPPFCQSGARRRRVDQHLQHDPPGLALRRVQAVRLWPGIGQARARPLHAGQKRVGGFVGRADRVVWQLAGC